MQKATVGPKKRGRPPKFVRQAVIMAAIDAFWDNGLEATTLPDLEDATGVDRSTLYKSFGGKTGLYELATSRYLEQAETWLFQPLLEGTSDGLTDIVHFLERLKEGLTSADRPGCLIINDMAAGPDKRPSERYQGLLRSSVAEALGRGGASSSTVADQRAGLITSAVIGINLMSKSGRNGEEVGQLIDGIIAQVEDWRS